MGLPWAIHSATLMHLPWDDELRLWERFGWTAAELWYDKAVATGRSFDDLARQLRDAGIEPIGLCPAVVWNSAQGLDPVAERDQWAERLDAAAALGAPALTVVVAGKVGDDLATEYDAAAAKLATLTDLAVERELRVNLEFLGGEKVCGTLSGGIELIRRVDHPALGLLFDLCHYWLSSSHLEELPQLPPGKLFLVHVDDVCRGPLEAQTTTSRGLLGEGRLDIPRLLRNVRGIAGYEGWYSIELYDPVVWDMDPELVLRRTAEALRRLDERLEAG